MCSVSVHTSFFSSITKTTSRPIRPCRSLRSPRTSFISSLGWRTAGSGAVFLQGPLVLEQPTYRTRASGCRSVQVKTQAIYCPLSDSPLLLICFLLLQTRCRLVLLFGSQCRVAVNWTCRNTFTPPAAAVRIQGPEYNNQICCSVVFLHPNVSNTPHRSNSVSRSPFICRLSFNRLII